jgi:membrane protease YdiL (CAAX protease family)
MSITESPRLAGDYRSQTGSDDSLSGDTVDSGIFQLESIIVENRPRSEGYTMPQLVAGVAAGFGLGLAVGCSLGRINSHAVANMAIEYTKRFAIGCGIGLVAFPLKSAIAGSLPDIDVPLRINQLNRVEASRNMAANFTSTVVRGPLMEEALFRGIIQDLLLSRFLLFAIQKLAPGREIVLEVQIAKALRIGITALLFGVAHLTNGHGGVRRQAIMTTLSGILLGYLKESRLGILATIGAHVTNNACGHALIVRSRQAAEHRMLQALNEPLHQMQQRDGHGHFPQDVAADPHPPLQEINAPALPIHARAVDEQEPPVQGVDEQAPNIVAPQQPFLQDNRPLQRIIEVDEYGNPIQEREEPRHLQETDEPVPPIQEMPAQNQLQETDE